jgi:hypothetical protein
MGSAQAQRGDRASQAGGYGGLPAAKRRTKYGIINNRHASAYICIANIASGKLTGERNQRCRAEPRLPAFTADAFSVIQTREICTAK